LNGIERPDHSSKQKTVCGLSLHLGNTGSWKNLEQKFIFEIGTLKCPWYQRTLYIKLIYSCFSRCHVPINSKLHRSPYEQRATHTLFNRSDEGLTLESAAFYFATYQLSYQLNQLTVIYKQNLRA